MSSSPRALVLRLQGTDRGQMTLTIGGVVLESWREVSVPPMRMNCVPPLWMEVFSPIGESLANVQLPV